MGREFAGVFGFLAYSTVVARSILLGGGFDETVKWALMMLFAFAGVGYVIGNIAQQTVRESVLITLGAELKKAEPRSTETGAD